MIGLKEAITAGGSESISETLERSTGLSSERVLAELPIVVEAARMSIQAKGWGEPALEHVGEETAIQFMLISLGAALYHHNAPAK